MRIEVYVSPSGLTLPPGRRQPHPKRGEPVAPCIDPDCVDPLGGLPHRDTKSSRPRRIHGRCCTCYKRRWNAVRRERRGLPPVVHRVARCKDPKCRRPRGGLPKRPGQRPARIHGFCRTCWNRRVKRWRDAQRRQSSAA